MRISDWSSDVCSSDLDDQSATTALKDPSKDERKNSFLETARFLLTVGILAVALRSFLFAPFNIPSESMLPRLMVGDYLFVAKWQIGRASCRERVCQYV